MLNIWCCLEVIAFEKDTSQSSDVGEVFDAPNVIVLQVQRSELHLRIEILDLLLAVIVQIQCLQDSLCFQVLYL